MEAQLAVLQRRVEGGGSEADVCAATLALLKSKSIPWSILLRQLPPGLAVELARSLEGFKRSTDDGAGRAVLRAAAAIRSARRAAAMVAAGGRSRSALRAA